MKTAKKHNKIAFYAVLSIISVLTLGMLFQYSSTGDKYAGNVILREQSSFVGSRNSACYDSKISNQSDFGKIKNDVSTQIQPVKINSRLVSVQPKVKSTNANIQPRKANTQSFSASSTSYNMRTGNGVTNLGSNLAYNSIKQVSTSDMSNAFDGSRLDMPMTRNIPDKPGSPGTVPVSSPLVLLFFTCIYFVIKIKR